MILVSIDIVLSLVTPYLQSIEFFADKSGLLVLSNLLFLEGAAIFSIGAFWGATAKDFRSRLPQVACLILIGAIFFGFSVLVGELFVRH